MSIFLVALAVLSGISVYYALFRFVSRDEGYYLYAARDILFDRVPYIDFFYPQMPFQPFVFAAVFSLFGSSWMTARLFVAVLTILSGLLIFRLTRLSHGAIWGSGAMVLYALSTPLMVWSTTAQTYALSIFLLLASVSLFRTRRNYVAAGIVFALCVMTRLTFAPLCVLFCIEIALQDPARWRASLLAFVGGFAFGMIPALVLFAAAPDIFLFNNIYYHLSKSKLSVSYVSSQRWKIFLSLVGMRPAQALNVFQFSSLLYAGMVGAVILKMRTSKVDFNFLIGFSLLLIHLFPSPPYMQYFACCIPWFVLSSIGTMRYGTQILRENCGQSGRVVVGLICFGFISNYIYSAYSFGYRYTISGDRVIGVGTVNADSWRLSTIRAVSRQLNSYLKEGQKVLATWPGYLIETRGRALCRTENHFGMQYAARVPLTKDERRRLRIKRPSKVLEAYAERKFDVAVVYTGINRTNGMQKELIRNGAIEKDVIEGVVIFDRAVEG